MGIAAYALALMASFQTLLDFLLITIRA